MSQIVEQDFDTSEYEDELAQEWINSHCTKAIDDVTDEHLNELVRRRQQKNNLGNSTA